MHLAGGPGREKGTTWAEKSSDDREAPSRVSPGSPMSSVWFRLDMGQKAAGYFDTVAAFVARFSADHGRAKPGA
jgi:hypothetical protein